MTDDVSQPGKAFSLALRLANPDKMGEVLEWLHAPANWGDIHKGLAGIDTLHYARFLPLERLGVLLFVAEYDGLRSEFVRALATSVGGPLTKLLTWMAGAPTKPVGEDPDGFAGYVKGLPGGDAPVFSSYADKTAKDVLGSGAPPAEPPAPGPTDPDTSKRVGGAFNLVMTLRDPHRLLELMSRLEDPYTKGRIGVALASLNYIHYARFLPLANERGAVLMILTEFDGVMHDYVTDFAAALDREFSLILSYMEGGPQLPVSQYPREFWDYVVGHLAKDTGLYAAYPDKTVLDIVGPSQPKMNPQRPRAPAVQVDLADVQANVLRGFRPSKAYHYLLRFSNAEAGRKFVRNFPVTSAGDKPQDDSVCLNIGLTHAGLQALGLPQFLLQSFPAAFQQGPAARANLTGDLHPEDWQVGADANAVHAVVSVLCRPRADDAYARQAVESLMASHDVEPLLPQSAQERFAWKAEAFDGAPNEIHFGYHDGISQPLIEGVHDPVQTGREANAVPGDFLLGHDYVNSRGGRYIGSLHEPLVCNGTYASFRIIEQKVAEFDRWLAGKHPVPADLLAAKVMGRWKDGTPITQSDTPAGGTPSDDFDYVGPLGGNDASGQRCPVGAHIRRLNPRAGLVLGVPWGRQILRRGLPYGPRREANAPDDGKPRGLVGMFMCGDLEAQFEFLLHVWGRNDLSAYGLRGTQDPFTSGAPTVFRMPLGNGTVDIEVPQLTQTLGSLYLFMPGVKALNWIGRGEWPLVERPQAPATPSEPDFDPTKHPDFRQDPYKYYAEFRKAGKPVIRVGGGYDSYWVLSHDLVTEVCRPENQNLFQKPGKNRLKQDLPFGIDGNTSDGLFFMDPPRHTDVRPALDAVFKTAITPLLAQLDAKAAEVAKDLPGKAPLEVVTGFAAKLAPWAFEEAFGFRTGTAERLMVEQWTRAMLTGRDPNQDRGLRAVGGTAGLALRAYLNGLTRDQALPAGGCKAATTTILSGLHKLSACPVLNMPLNRDEVTNTSSHFALGGYLSTEFLIITGIYNLAGHPDQWAALHKNPDPQLIKKAVWEMLRYDAPFQMADRWVTRDCYLGGVALPANSKLTVVYGAANRDEARFKDRPDDFDISRVPDTTNIYGFGHGIHRCIGEELAIAVTAAAIGAIVKVCSSPKVLSGKDKWLPDPYFRSLSEFSIALS